MGIRVSRILHAGYIFECGGIRLLFDPIFENPFSRNCFAYPAVKFDLVTLKKEKFDAIFISHYHDDHCSFESLNELDRRTPIFIFCLHEAMFVLLRKLGFQDVRALRWDEPVVVGPFSVTTKRALDLDVDAIFHIAADGLNILNVVDSWIDDRTLRGLSRIQWDVVLWPFQTLREIEVLAPKRGEKAVRTLPPEWIPQLKSLAPRILVPSSCQFRHEDWSWYNFAMFPISYAQFRSEMRLALPRSEVVRLDPGSSIEIERQSWSEVDPIDWIEMNKSQVVDYDFDDVFAIPSTEEISKHFHKLTEDEKQVVLDFATSGLANLYPKLSPSAEPYFDVPRVWKLSLYHHEEIFVFYYKLAEGKLERLTSPKAPEWATDVPMMKLHAALVNGESLTSMYVRVNEEINEEVDVMEDPLIRCLFTNVFANYQSTQLEKINRNRR